jgi:large subunit ribosomal protein L7Ae
MVMPGGFLLHNNNKNKMASIYDTVEKARKTGKIEKGINEVTKAVERGTAKLVVIASDVEPKEITQHIPILCKEKEIKCIEADSKQKLGISAGINVSCSAIVVIDAGEADLDLVKK